MKAVFLLAVLTVFVLLPDDGEAGWWRSKVVDRVKNTWRKVKGKAKETWRKIKEKVGRRDLGDIDFDQDGAIDQAEMEAVIGERHARDLWSLMNAGNLVTFDEFERNVRDLDELEDDDEFSDDEFERNVLDELEEEDE